MDEEKEELRQALRDVLDALNALHNRWWELRDHGFTEERAKEICALVYDGTP